MEVLQPQAVATAPAPVYKSNEFSGTEGMYMLPHHALEIDRLQRQHRFMKGTTDGALLTRSLPSEAKALRVLDCGAADGMFPLQNP